MFNRTLTFEINLCLPSLHSETRKISLTLTIMKMNGTEITFIDPYDNLQSPLSVELFKTANNAVRIA